MPNMHAVDQISLKFPISDVNTDDDNVRQVRQLTSTQDLSVNFVAANGQESRYVRRTNDYFIVYLSSHNGCEKACRFCHLTQTGQTAFDEASVSDMLDQARLVLEHHRRRVATGEEPSAHRVHFNWMARGDPLASSVVRTQWRALTAGLAELAGSCGLKEFRFNVSSIFPAAECAQGSLQLLDGPHCPTVFYSLYSLEADFRRRWLPKALDPEIVLKELATWQAATGGDVVFHWALIAGENDSEAAVSQIAEAIEQHGIRGRFNLVRYNPFSDRQGVESDDLTRQIRFDRLKDSMRSPGSRVVPRVGFDVQASCGMFVQTSV